MDKQEMAARSMYFWQKGWIFTLVDKNVTFEEIAKITEFGIDRIKCMVNALRNTNARNDAIEAYNERMESNEQCPVKSQSRGKTRTKISPRRHKKLHIQRTKEALSGNRISTRNDRTEYKQRDRSPGVHSNKGILE